MLLIVASVLTTTVANAQVRVTGSVVSSETGVALQAAHVQIENTSQGSITNQQGRFELLTPGLPVTLLVRYIGYHSQRIIVDVDSFRNLTIRLDPAVVELEEVVVSGVDRAERIMREVARRKRILRDTLRTQSAKAYSRLTLSTGGEFELIRETVWDEYRKQGSGQRNVVRSFRQTSGLYDSFNLEPVEVLNFYDDLIQINGLSFVGPTHPDAEATYEFSMGGSVMVDSMRAYEIYMAPRSPIRPSFIGTITVVDSLYTIAEVDLRPARHVEFPNGFDSWRVSYTQHFAEVDGDVWFPIDLVAQGRISRETRDQDYLSAYLEIYARLNEYELNRNVPLEPFFTNATVQIDSVSVFEDYLFMRGRNIIPMTPLEEDAFQRLLQDPHRLASVFRDRRQYDVLSFIRPRIYRRDGPQFVFPTVRGYVPRFRFNRVDGLFSGIGQGGMLARQTRIAWGLGQSSGSGGIRYNLEFEQGVGARTTVGVHLRRDMESIAESSIYSTTMSSLSSVAGRGDYFDYYWSRRVSAEINHRWDFVRLQLLGYYDRDEPRSTAIGRSWPWGTAYRDNPSIVDSSSTGVKLSIRLGDSYEPYHTDTKGLVIEYEQGIDRQFGRVSTSADWSIATLFRNTIRPNRLKLRVSAGALVGDGPLQRLGGLDGALLGFGTLGVFRSLRDRQIPGDNWAGVYLDHDFGAVLFDKMRLRGLSETRTGLHVFGAVGRVGIRSSDAEATAIYGSSSTTRSEVGISVSNIMGSGIRLDAGRRLDTNGYFFGFGLGKR